MTKATVLFSGGQDSTTCLFWAKESFDKVIAVGFDYGQKHRVEIEQARKIAEIAGVEYILLDIKGLLGGSSLTDHSQDSNDPHKTNPSLPASFVAGRNALFLTAVGSYSYGRGITDIVTGVCETDFSGYPDCRRSFIDAQEKALSLALDTSVAIHTPLMEMTKAEAWKLAKDLSKKEQDVFEIVRTMSLTDYNGSTEMNEWGMGKLDNPASELRAKGYYEAKEKGWI